MVRVKAGFQASGVHAAWSLSLVLDGCIERLQPTDCRLVEEETLTLLRPGCRSQWRVPDDCDEARIIWFVFRPPLHWSDLLAWTATPFCLAGSPLSREVKAALLRAHRHSRSPHPNRAALVMNAIEGALLLCQSAVAVQRQARDPRIDAVIAHLTRHLDLPLTLEEAMRVACLSRSRLAELFKRQTGCSVMTYLERERMARARNLLTLTQMPIKQIAGTLGFDDPAYFSRRFSMTQGASPQRYRERAGEGVALTRSM